MINEPKVDGLHAEAHHNQLWIRGRFQPATKYQLSLPESIRDEFGQSLPATRLEFDVRDRKPEILMQSSAMHVTTPQQADAFVLSTLYIPRVIVQVRRVTSGDWKSFEKTGFRPWAPTHRGVVGDKLSGTVVFERELDTAGMRNQPNETTIDLSPALEDGFGSAVVWFAPLDVSPSVRHVGKGSVKSR